MTRVYALTNHKGGVGKSTSVTNIALGIAAMLRNAGTSNSIVHTDSQAHATLVATGKNDYKRQLSTRPSFSLMTEMAAVTATDAIFRLNLVILRQSVY